MQVKFSPYGQTGDLWVKLLGRISLKDLGQFPIQSAQILAACG